MAAALHSTRVSSGGPRVSYRKGEASEVTKLATKQWDVRRLRDERGAAMTEYALLLFLVSIVGFVGVVAVGGGESSLFTHLQDALETIFD